MRGAGDHEVAARLEQQAANAWSRRRRRWRRSRPAARGPGSQSRKVWQSGSVAWNQHIHGYRSRRDLRLTTARQSEQGCGRRHLPGLCPPDHVGPTAGARDSSRPGTSVTLRSRSVTVTGRSRSRSRRGRRGRRPRSCGRPRPVPRRRSCAGTLLPARLGEESLASGHGATRF